LYDPGISIIDIGDQSGARSQYHLYWIIRAPSLVKGWDGSCLEIECDKFRELFDTKWARSRGDALKEMQGTFPVLLIDVF
jgi:hypothetical protein